MCVFCFFICVFRPLIKKNKKQKIKTFQVNGRRTTHLRNQNVHCVYYRYVCVYTKSFSLLLLFFSFRHHQLLIVLFYNLLMYQTFRWRGQVIDVTGLTWKWPYKAVLIVCFVFFWPASYNITLLPLFSMDKRIRATHQCQRASPSSIINVFLFCFSTLYAECCSLGQCYHHERAHHEQLYNKRYRHVWLLPVSPSFLY